MFSTVYWSDRRKIKLQSRQANEDASKHAVMKTLSIRDSFEGMNKNCKNHEHQNGCEFLFMIPPFRVESLNNKLSDMTTVESRFLEPSVSRASRYLEPNEMKWSFCWIIVSLSFPVWQLLLWMAPNHFHLRDVVWLGLFLQLRQALCHSCMILPAINVFRTCFRHFKQDLNRKLKFLSTCWINSPQ